MRESQLGGVVEATGFLDGTAERIGEALRDLGIDLHRGNLIAELGALDRTIARLTDLEVPGDPEPVRLERIRLEQRGAEIRRQLWPAKSESGPVADGAAS